MLMPFLVPVTLLGALSAAAMVVYLAAARYVSWDLLPDAAVARVRWWHRHAPAVLLGSTVVAVVGGALVVWAP
jgi:hypothetical protein